MEDFCREYIGGKRIQQFELDLQKQETQDNETIKKIYALVTHKIISTNNYQYNLYII